MTRLRRMQRSANGRRTDFVLTLDADTVTLRPKRCRRPEASVTVSWDWIYAQALLARPPKRRRRVKRGVLAR